MKILAICELIHSKCDTFGNCYWALAYTSTETGATVRGLAPCENNVRHAFGYHGGPSPHGLPPAAQVWFAVRELPIREFNRLTRGWLSSIGHDTAEIAAFCLQAHKQTTTTTP